MSADHPGSPGIDVLMPKIGQAMSAGTVVEWHRGDGEQVQAGEVLVTIETDKSTYELEAQGTGVLHTLVREGQEADVGSVIATIGDRAADKPRVLASPKARRLAAELGVDLGTVVASASDGVLSTDDVRRAVPAVATSSRRVVRERRPLTGARKTAARRLHTAWKTIPHIVQMVDVDATSLLAESSRPDAAASLNDLVLHAAAHTLVTLPELNGTVADDVLTLYEGVDVGFAVDSPRGLVVPVIRNADRLAEGELAAESARLVEAARAGRLRSDDMGDASVTVSNLGMFGVRSGTPIINLGESILVFVGAIEDRPVAVRGEIVIRPMLTLSIAYDHRVADGVAASRYTSRLRERLERPPVLAPSPSARQPAPGRRVEAVSGGDAFSVAVQASGHRWTLDEPTAVGGTGSGPDPVDSLLGALLGCMIISFKAQARRRGIAITRITGTAAAGSGRLAPLSVALTVVSSETDARVRALLEPATRACSVKRALDAEIDVAVSLDVSST